MFAYRFIDNINYSVYLSTLKSFNGHYIHYLLKLIVQSMAAILVLMAVIRQDWGSHQIEGATKEREWLVQGGVGTRSRSQQNMIDVF